MKEVFINRASAFLPNETVYNDELEEYLGYVNGKKSRSKEIILRRNGIKERYYAIDKEGKSTHTNAQMTANAVRGLFENKSDIESIDLLACGTSSPDQLMPSHAVMTHGELKEIKSIEVVSPAGVCASGMHALKYAFMSLKLGDKKKAVATGSERLGITMTSSKFEEEVQKLLELEENPYIGFEKDFLRWMLSDGAGALLLETEKNPNDISLRIDWMEACSFAHEMETCMYMGCEKDEAGNVVSYKDFDISAFAEKSLMSIKQDVKLLGNNIVKKGNELLLQAIEKHGAKIEDLDYFLPHLSSFVFKQPILDTLEEDGLGIPEEKWFTNLATKGNVGAGSIYLMVEELFNSGKLKKGDQIMLFVPESSRFSYVITWLTVC